MSYKIKIRLFLGFAIACWCIVACWAMFSQQQGSAVDPIYPSIHGDIYSGTENFQPPSTADSATYHGSINVMIAANPEDDPIAAGSAIALLAAHHRSEPVVLLCFESGVGSVPLYGDEHWQTSYGVTNVNRDFLSRFETLDAVSDNEVLGGFGDLGAMMTYFGYYMQGFTVAPLILDVTASTGEVQSLVSELSQFTKNTSVVVMLPQGTSAAPLPTTDENDFERYFSDENNDYSGVFGQKAALALTAFHGLAEEEIDVYAYHEKSPTVLSDLMIVSGE